MKAISLFSNCGAGDIGYSQAGFDFRVMAELDPDRLAVALANHPAATGIPGDLRKTWPDAVAAWRSLEGSERPDLLAACPPCQGMSSARSGLGSHKDLEAGGRDPRNLLVTVIESVARELRPRAIVVENVPAFLTRQVPNPLDGTPISAARLLIEALRDEYKVFAMVADLADWGVPQTRKRAFLTLIRRNEKAERPGSTPFPAPTHGGARPRVSITEALGQLGASVLDARDPGAASDPGNPMHFVPVWTEQRYMMVEAIAPNSGKGAWENDVCPRCGATSHDRDAALCARCDTPLLRPVVRDGNGWRLIKGFRNSSYSRMRADMPAATITTASGRVGSDKTIHPWENRLLSPYECAYLQTLPADFRWGDALERWGHTRVREMIGEAVPPRFTRLHGQAIRAFLGAADSDEIDLLDDEEKRVRRAHQLIDVSDQNGQAKEDL
ncbi:DNA cytosine methyltransferase [Labedella phragmitis]|uniref:DNA (cytosine-5-)-methyltransferase n=1 Tax=Labedella phragmitis TaxID=2498849 RepID=A0A3S3YVR1_9MICO|nr:DNA cytosine methyltransferase [Labedella phragmitis]RWZ46145.1 DNA cytosine methyltransferase [Labedella phragmitis]